MTLFGAGTGGTHRRNEVALAAAVAQIAGEPYWLPVERVRGQVNLEGAAIGELAGYWTCGRADGYWPTGGRLRLDGFTYGRFGGDQQAVVCQAGGREREDRQPVYQGGAGGGPGL